MAEQDDHKFNLPLAGVLALVAVVSGLIAYQNPLKTSRPIDQQAERKAGRLDRVQSRLWQDPFEAVKTHRLNELERQKNANSGHKTKPPTFKDNIIDDIRNGGGSSSFRILIVVVDGNPYASGVEARLKDRYAVVSALGVAGYTPESGEYIRYFFRPEERPEKERLEDDAIPVERFIPKSKIRGSNPQDVLVLWLKDQDFSEKPIEYLSKFVSHLKEQTKTTERAKPTDSIPDVYTVLGPRFSSTLSAMLKELQDYQREWEGSPEVLQVHRNKSHIFTPVCPMRLKDVHRLQSMGYGFFNAKPALRELKDVTIYSYWATAEDTFLLNHPPGVIKPEMSVDELFKLAHIRLERTIKTDAVLAEQLVRELYQRNVDLSCINKAAKCTPPLIALVSEWDTVYGRALPRTFVAVAENMAESLFKDMKKSDAEKMAKTAPQKTVTNVTWSEERTRAWKIDAQKLGSDIDKLRNDDWPPWVVHYSYLAGLDGELPSKKEGKNVDEARPKDKTDDKEERVRRAMEVAEGRDQLDYLQRLAEELKPDVERLKSPDQINSKAENVLERLVELAKGSRKKEFNAIGILGGDVYDKQLILQALRKKFPRAIFFTMDLDARLIHPAQWQWTRNLIVATHFGLQLHPEIQGSIPPFRDNSQTSLFYSVLQALGHLRIAPGPFAKPPLELNSTAAGTKTTCALTNEPLGCFSTDVKPKLYEIGRNGAIDISDEPMLSDGEFKSIHPPRPDLDNGKLRRPVEMETIIWGALLIVSLGLCARMISSEVEEVFRLHSFRYAVSGIFVFIIFLVLLARRDGWGGEPLVLTEGVSAWPSVGIYLLAIALFFGFYCLSQKMLRENDKKLSIKFALPPPPTPGESACSPSGRRGACLSEVRWPSIPRWSHTTKCGSNIGTLWEEYRIRGSLNNSFTRILPQFFLLVIFLVLLFWKVGLPMIPCRGFACFDIYRLMACSSMAAMFLLTLYVIDTARLCRRLIRILCEKQFPWGDNDRMRDESTRRGVDKEYLNELLCIELTAKRTAVISNLLYFPFIILFLIGVARYPYIDNFDLPIELVIIYGTIAAYAIGTVVALRVSADRAKRKAIEQLQMKLDKLSRQRNGPLTGDEKRQRRQIDQVIEVIEEIQNNHEGGFLPFHKYPVLGAIMVPAGGTGLLYLIDYLATTL